MRLAYSLGLPAVAAAAAAAAAAIAAPPAAPASQQIVVTGQLQSDAAIHRFVEAVARPSQGDRIGRFEKGVCPMVVGLKEPMSGQVERRMRRVAAAAGIQVAPEGCAGNALLFVTSDDEAFIAGLRKDRPRLLAGLNQVQLAALRKGDGAAAWQLLEVRGADGRTLGNGNNDDDVPSSLSSVTSSRLLPQTRVDFDLSVVVVDSAAVAGVTPTQLADYAAMRTFAKTDPAAAAGQPAPTILTLLLDKQANRASPLSVTAWDIAYLKSLYGIANVLAGGGQRAEIHQLMRRNLSSARPAGS